MNEMINRVARAMHGREPRGSHWRPWEEIADRYREEWRSCARAAIEALREPTEAMIEEGEYNPDCHRTGPRGLESDLAAQWRVMIDFLLKGDQDRG